MSKGPTGSTKVCVEFTRAVIVAMRELEEDAAHQRIIELWDDLRISLYGKLAGEDAFHAFARENGLVQLAMQQHGGDAQALEKLLLHLAKSLRNADRRVEFEACLEEAERWADSETRRSYRRELKELRDELSADSEDGGESRDGQRTNDDGRSLHEQHPKVYRKDGSLRETPRKILKQLPNPTLDALARASGLEPGTVRDISKAMQDANLMAITEKGVMLVTESASGS